MDLACANWLAMLSIVSLAAVAVMLAAVALGWSRRFLASGALLVANLVVFLLTILGPEVSYVAATPFGPIPTTVPAIHAELSLRAVDLWDAKPLAFLQLFTSLSVHADLLHILGNLLVLWAFGMPFEERVGHRKFLAIYLLSGFAGSLLQAAVFPRDALLSMGASGAIFGIMAAFATRYPRQVVPVPLPLGFMLLRIPMPVAVGALLYLGLQVFDLVLLASSPGLRSNVGYGAHMGGAAMGALLALAWVRPNQAKRQVAVDLRALEPFARDAKTRQVWDHLLSNHDEPAVFQAWLDRFFRSATCPTCGHRVVPRPRGEVVCTQNHTFDVRKGPSAPPSAPLAAALQPK